jgi:hypothetical protein
MQEGIVCCLSRPSERALRLCRALMVDALWTPFLRRVGGLLSPVERLERDHIQTLVMPRGSVPYGRKILHTEKWRSKQSVAWRARDRAMVRCNLESGVRSVYNKKEC